MRIVEARSMATNETTTALREARRRAGLTAEALATRAGLSLGWLRVCERAPQFMSPSLAARLAEALGVEPRDLLGAVGGTRRRMF